MGREVQCAARWPGGEGEVKALLESRELILRGPAKRVLPLAALKNVAATDGALKFEAAGEAYELVLGDKAAASWARKILTPPPTLAEKLGVGPAAKVLAIGPIDDADLAAALAGATTTNPSQAAMSLAVVEDAAALEAALSAHAAVGDAAPIWVVNRKGKAAQFGENTVRSAMRSAGFMDNKTSAVSEAFAATRYARPRKG